MNANLSRWLKPDVGYRPRKGRCMVCTVSVDIDDSGTEKYPSPYQNPTASQTGIGLHFEGLYFGLGPRISSQPYAVPGSNNRVQNDGTTNRSPIPFAFDEAPGNSDPSNVSTLRLTSQAHPHCWELIDRVIGRRLVEDNPDLFIRATDKFWKENPRNLKLSDRFWRDFEGPLPSLDLGFGRRRDWYFMTNMRVKGHSFDVGNIPEIRTLIDQARERYFQGFIESARRQRCEKPFAYPLDLALSIVDAIHNGGNHGPSALQDTRNLLHAFQWELPVSYWQRRCNKELIFELGDLINSEDVDCNLTIDWQYLCLATEELITNRESYEKTGLSRRMRLLKLLEGIKGIFMDMVDSEGKRSELPEP